jgi:quinol monooxygenase YgiN
MGLILACSDYQSHKQHNWHKDTDFKGSGIAPLLKNIMNPKGTDLYFIYPHTPDRHILYAPQTNVVFFYGIDEDMFAELAPEFFTAIEKSDSCLGYIWGEIEWPAREDSSGHEKLGKGGVMISGWRSKEEHDRDVQKPRVTEAYAAMDRVCKKKDTWGMQVRIVENSGYFHKWTRLTKSDRSKFLPTAGSHSQTL